MIEITDDYMDSMYNNEKGYDNKFDKWLYDLAEQKALQDEIDRLSKEEE